MAVASGDEFVACAGLAQVNALLGFRTPVPLLGIPSHAAAIRPLALAVGLVTTLVIWYGPRITRRIPSPIAGLGAGVALHHALSLLGFGASLGPTLGTIPAVTPTFTGSPRSRARSST